MALHGPASQPIEIDAVGKVDTVNARLRTTFETLPDAPVSSAVISLLGAGKGLLVNNTNLCTHKNNATVLLDGQNGKTADSTPKVSVACRKAAQSTTNTTNAITAATARGEVGARGPKCPQAGGAAAHSAAAPLS